MIDGERFWIIGHKEDFDWIIIGENTGPYPGFPSFEYSKTIEGNFHYLENFVSQIEGKKFRCTVAPAFSKCPYLDDLNRNVREPLKSLDSIEEVVSYLRKESEHLARSIYIGKYCKDNKILERFSTEGLEPHESFSKLTLFFF